MVNALMLEELHELIGHKGRAIVSVDVAGWSIHGYELLKLLGKG